MAVKIVPKDEMVNAVGTRFEPGEWIETRARSTIPDSTAIARFRDHFVVGLTLLRPLGADVIVLASTDGMTWEERASTSIEGNLFDTTLQFVDTGS